MKKNIFSFVILFGGMLAALMVNGQQKNNYEAAGWKTWLLDDANSIAIPHAPSDAQSKTELALVKQRVAHVNAEKLGAIQYWNAGAPAYRWNQTIQKLVETKPEVMLRFPASWMNIAIYDATILAWKEKLKNKRTHPAITNPVVEAPTSFSYPCEYSVTASAAAHVLAYFFPEKADSILKLAHMAAQSRIDAGVQYPSDVDAGWNLGEQVAKQVIEKAKHDGSDIKWNGAMNKDPKKWTGAYPMGITLASFTPIVLREAKQFRPPPPPDFENDMKELKNFKQSSATKYIALYWANNADVWTDLAGKKMFENHMQDNAPAVARVYAALTTAYHEMAIAVFDAKYTYWGIRPFQYDSTYKPLITTPPFPGYPSGHAAGAGTSAAVMEYFFPADAAEFRRLAQECADSRFYAGIHFRTDNETALTMGRAVGKYVVETWVGK